MQVYLLLLTHCLQLSLLKVNQSVMKTVSQLTEIERLPNTVTTTLV
ncbi:hypothetical protein O9993_18470 [Vibrio lentus]|nr:hypothetical protein [Vibrio lentus]